MIDDWQIVPLAKEHRRDSFDCDSTELNTFLRKFARQNSNKGLGRTYVAVLPNEVVVRGYYSLSTSAVACESLPEESRKHLPSYPIPTALISRLAVDKSAQGRGLGRELLLDAIYRVIQVSEQMGIYAVEIEAKDENARAFYAKYGFAAMLDTERHMFLSLKTARRAFQ